MEITLKLNLLLTRHYSIRVCACSGEFHLLIPVFTAFELNPFSTFR